MALPSFPIEENLGSKLSSPLSLAKKKKPTKYQLHLLPLLLDLISTAINSLNQHQLLTINLGYETLISFLLHISFTFFILKINFILFPQISQ